MQELKSRSGHRGHRVLVCQPENGAGNMVGARLFQHEKSPSFNVHGKRVVDCFSGCGAGGDVITFIRKMKIWTISRRSSCSHSARACRCLSRGVDDSMPPPAPGVLGSATRRAFCLALREARGAGRGSRAAGCPMHMIRHFGLGWAPGKPLRSSTTCARRGILKAR